MRWIIVVALATIAIHLHAQAQPPGRGEPVAGEEQPGKGKEQRRRLIDLEKVSEITVDEAQALTAKFVGKLHLRGLTQLSPEVAKVLTQQLGKGSTDAPGGGRNAISLPSLKTLSDDTAKVLGRSKLAEINLDAVSSLSDEAATAFAEFIGPKHRGRLTLNSLNSLSFEAALKLTTADDKRTGDSPGLCPKALKTRIERLASSVGIRELSVEQATALIGNRDALKVDPALEGLARAQAEFDKKRDTLDLRGLRTLPSEVAEVLAKHNGRLILAPTELADQAALALAKHKGPLCLNSVTLLTPSAALALARHEGELHLGGLKRVSPEAAQSLAAHPNILPVQTRSLLALISDAAQKKELTVEQARMLMEADQGPLNLDGLTTLSPEVAAVLAEHKGALHLGGLKSLQPDAARALSRYGGETLHLNGLTSVSDDVAAALAQIPSDLHLDGIRVFSNSLKTVSTATTQAFSTKPNIYPSPVKILLGLPQDVSQAQHLSVEQAESLSRDNQGPLNLDGLATLSAEVAEALSQHRGILHLNGLGSLSPDAAEGLAQHKGDLYLRKLPTLAPQVAKALAAHTGPIHLDGLKQISPEAAGFLVGNTGIFPPRVKSLLEIVQAPIRAQELSVDHARALLANGAGPLNLDGLTTLSPEVAAVLAEHKGALHLGGLKSLQPDAARALSRYGGETLHLNGLTSVSDDVAAALAHTPSDLHLDGLSVFREGTKALSPSAANALLKKRNVFPSRVTVLLELPAHTWEIKQLSDEQARVVSESQKHSLLLDGLETLSPTVATVLAAYPDALHLDGLVSLTPEVAGVLAKHKGDLFLNGLTQLTPAVASQLAAHEGGTLHLDGVERLSENVAVSLAARKDDICLAGLKQYSEAAARALQAKGNIFPQRIQVLLTLPEGTNDITNLSPEQAAALTETYPGQLRLDSLATAPPDVAVVLARHEGELHLGGLKRISPEAAKTLAAHPKILPVQTASLLALVRDAAQTQTLTVEQAHMLIEAYQGPLNLGALTTLSPEVAAVLAEHKDSLCLDGLGLLSDESAKRLARHAGELSLDELKLFSDGVKTISEESAAALAAKPGLSPSRLRVLLDMQARTDQIRELTAEEARALVACSQGRLPLPGLTTISPEAAKVLALYDNEVALDSLATISPDVAEVLATKSDIAPPEIKSLLGLVKNASKITDLNPKLASELISVHQGPLKLGSVKTISPDVAEVLAKYEGPLFLSGVIGLADNAATALARHEGELSLDGLTAISPEAAKAMAQHKGVLHLNGLISLSEEVILVLAEHGGELFLGGKAVLSASAATVLAKRHRGVLHLTGPTTLSDEAAKVLHGHPNIQIARPVLEYRRLDGTPITQLAIDEHNEQIKVKLTRFVIGLSLERQAEKLSQAQGFQRLFMQKILPQFVEGASGPNRDMVKAAMNVHAPDVASTEAVLRQGMGRILVVKGTTVMTYDEIWEQAIALWAQ